MKHERWDSRAVLWPCKDCGCEVSPVVKGKRHTWGLKDKTWKATGMKAQGKTPLGQGEFLCIKCTEARLGRQLELKDYSYTTNMPVSREQWRRWARAQARA
jgi:hypothetical protein